MSTTDMFSVTSKSLPANTRVLAFQGTEAISALYQFELHLLIDDVAFDMATALGTDATLSINREGGLPYLFHGVFASLETIADLEAGSIYRAEFVPRFHRLALGQHCRVFVNESVPEILEKILEENGITDYTLKLSANYPKLDHVCQYRESTYAFLSRRLEREGICYFFEHEGEREQLVFTDDVATHVPLVYSPVPYVRTVGRGAGGVVGLHAFTSKRTALVSGVQLSDRDYLRPALDISSQCTTSSFGEQVHLHHENAVNPADSERLAKVRAEEIRAREIVFRGGGTAFSLRTGYLFALEDHPRNGVDGDYLVTALSHRGNASGGFPDAKELLGLDGEGDDVYHVDVVAIPKGIPFRPERRTPTPRIYGMERALIDGADDTDYAQLDEHGRYLVKLHFDESPLMDGKGSARVRMMQPHGGSPESFHFPLRKGTEVLLSFEGGDPDRPVIAGVVPNAFNPSAVTAANATKNIVHTGGGNRIVIEDQEGKQYVHIRSAHKGTYLHLGAPFNPAYNKVSATLGTSLSFTQDISTSVTGADAQTLVEDSRVTIIGRSQISSSAPPGAEIARLLGPGFINVDPATDLFREIEAAVAQLIVDLKALKALQPVTATTKMSTVVSAIKAVALDLDALGEDAASYSSLPAGTPGFDAMLATTWTTQVNQAIQATGTASHDASATTPVPATVDADVTAAIASSSTAAGIDSSAFAPLVPAPATPPATPSSTMPVLPGPSATPTYINIPHPSWQTTSLSVTSSSPNTFQTIDGQSGWIHAQATGPNGTAPSAPPPSGTPVWFSDIETTDSTAMDGAPTNAPPLHSGSDVKIVGGDNVTMVSQDARSHVTGTSYGLVLGGQASVVRKGQQSKVYSPLKSGTAPPPTPTSPPFLLTPGPTTPATPGATTPPATGAPGLFSPLFFPLSPLPTADTTSNTAQRSEVYGDTFSWVDGTTTSTVTGGTQVIILSRAHSRPSIPPIPIPGAPPTPAWPTFSPGPWEPPMDRPGFMSGTATKVVDAHTTTPTALDTESLAQASEIFGDQVSFLNGSQTARITGDKTTTVEGAVTSIIQGGQTNFVSDQTSYVDNQFSYVGNSFKVGLASEDISLILKVALNTIAVNATLLSASFNVVKFEMTAMSMKTKSVNLAVKLFHCEAAGIWALQ